MTKVKVRLILLVFVLNVSISSAQTFTNLGTGINMPARTLYADTTTGILYVGGDFLDAGGVPVQHIAMWNGISWNSMGSNLFWFVQDITKFRDTIYAASSIPGGVQKWDGTNWSDISNTAGASTYGLFATDTSLYIIGSYESIGTINSRYISSYDGINLSSMPPVGDPTLNAYNAIVYNSDVYLAGNYYNSQNSSINDIAYLHNSSWLPVINGIQSGFGFVSCFTIYQNKLVIGGTFQTSWGDPANSVMLWDGTNLTQLGIGLEGDVRDMLVYNNELYVGGGFIDPISGQYGSNLVKWNGTQWSNLNLTFNNNVTALATLNNDLFVAGAFTLVNGTAINRILKLTLPVSDELNIEERKFAIYPNPNQGEFYVNGESQVDEIELLDVSGKLIETLILDGEKKPQKVMLNSVSPGIYIVKLKFNSEVSYKKIIID